MQRSAAVSLHFAVDQVLPAQSGQPVRFAGIAYSGGVIPSYGWYGDVAIDLASLQNDGDTVAVLEDHQTLIQSIVGRGTIARVEAEGGITALRIDGEITEATDAGQRIARLLSERYPLQLSLGLQANVREVSGPVQINGQTLTVAAVFEKAIVRECSFVPVAADPDTTVARLSRGTSRSQHDQERRTMSDDTTIADLMAKLEAAQAALAAERATRRKAELAALYNEIGRPMPREDALGPYLAMSDESFAAFSADLRSVASDKRRLRDSALFAATSLSMQRSGASPLETAVAKLIKQHA